MKTDPASASYTSLALRHGPLYGHQRDARKIETELGWQAAESFETGLRRTVQWYFDNPTWLKDVTSGAYQKWIAKNYAARTEAAAEEYAVAFIKAGAK